jgi:glycosyltransferase involved in cell wall biosynthesis
MKMAESVSQNEQPLVSVIMNCYNGEKYLREAVESVLAQTYQNWEIIFRDNQSTDRSANIFNSYNDPRLKYFYAQKHTLLYEARNCAIENSLGSFYALLDVDDWWHPNKLEKQIPLFNDPEVGLVHGNFYWINELNNTKKIAKKKRFSSGRILVNLIKQYDVGLLTLVLRKKAYDQLDSPFHPKYNVIGDFDLVIRISSSWKLGCVHEPVAFCRWHGNNMQIKEAHLFIQELEDWRIKMIEHPIIGNSFPVEFFDARICKMKILQSIIDGHRLNALFQISRLKLLKDKTKMYIACFLPVSIILNYKR